MTSTGKLWYCIQLPLTVNEDPAAKFYPIADVNQNRRNFCHTEKARGRFPSTVKSPSYGPDFAINTLGALAPGPHLESPGLYHCASKALRAPQGAMSERQSQESVAPLLLLI